MKLRAVLSAVIVAGMSVGSAGHDRPDLAAPASVAVLDALTRAHICQTRTVVAQSMAGAIDMDAHSARQLAVEPHEHGDAGHPRAAGPPSGDRRILHYRNPMGLADISPVPKKDQMGMDYIPIYEGEGGDGTSVHLPSERVQASGVQTEVVEARVLIQPIRGVGTVKYDEHRLTAVTVGVEGYVEDLYVKHVGQAVHVGEPLFRLSSNNSQMLQIEIARRTRSTGRSDTALPGLLTGNTSTSAADWPSPATGTVIEKRIMAGQRIGMADELLRIADMTQMWVVADFSEMDLPAIKPGLRVTITPRAYPNQPVEGTVLFVYPDLRAETRTARVAIEVPNPAGRLKAEMYADVVMRAGADGDPVIAVPDSALIRDGVETRVLVATGQGHFEPRIVKAGVHGVGYTQVLDGVGEGESVVTTAAFLIDSEANLQAALAAFRKPGNAP